MITRHLFPVLLVCSAPGLLAQFSASYAPYGTGCPGTGVGMGASHIAPQAYAATFMPSNNVMGFQGTPSRYQQVFLASEFPSAFVMNGLGLRWDNQNQLQMAGAAVDLEIRVGYTTMTPATLGTTFAANFDSGTPVTVLPRRNVNFPSEDNPPATDPTQFQVLIPWTNTFSWVPQPGLNLLIEMVNRGNSQGAWAYVLDCGWSASTARLYGSDTATTGSLDGFAYGYVMCFKEQTHVALPTLAGGDTPQYGSQLPINLTQATPSTFALLLTGLSRTSWGAFPLPLSLAAQGAPGCSLLASGDLFQLVNVSAAGRGTGFLDIPTNFALGGLSFYNQFAVYDPAANGLGFALSNGGVGVIGN